MFIFFCLVIFILEFSAIGYDHLEFFASIDCINLQLWTSGDLPIFYRQKVSVFSSLLSWRMKMLLIIFSAMRKGGVSVMQIGSDGLGPGFNHSCTSLQMITWWWQDLIWFLQLRMTRSLLGSARPAANLLQKFSKLASESNSLVVPSRAMCYGVNTVTVLLQCALFLQSAVCSFQNLLGKVIHF